MARWTVYDVVVLCGSCEFGKNRIQPGDPVQLVTSAELVRCAVHATEPVDWCAVDSERQRLDGMRERAAIASEAAQTRTPPAPRRSFLSPGFTRARDVRVPGFDAKLAAVGRDD